MSSPRWYRSWPLVAPERRAHVVDALSRLLMTGGDYSTLPAHQPWPTDEPGFCLLEWDVALGPDGMARFGQHAMEAPERVLVAPYLIYPVGSPPVLVHKAGRPAQRRPVAPGAARCDTWGLGCVYLPQRVLQAWLAEQPPAGSWRDITLATWHLAQYGPVPIDWTVHPQHLR